MSTHLMDGPIDVRESMGRLPGALQPFLTWLSGKPLHHQRPWRLTPLDHLLSAVAAVAAGVAAAAWAVGRSGWWLLLVPPAWLLTIHGVRKLRGVIAHQCAHASCFPSQRLNDLLGEAISVAFITQSYQIYKHEHIAAHHSHKHMTPEDPTVAFLLRMVGARAGMTREALWRRLGWTLVSPRFHAVFVWNRLRSNLHDAAVPHRLATLALWSAVIALVAAAGAWREFLVAWVLPLTIPLQAVECLRLSGKHVFPHRTVDKRGRDELATFTHGIFFGDPAPAAGVPLYRRAGAWGCWWLRLVFYHLPARMLVVVGDAPCHDWHHRHPKAKNWANYPFERQREVLSPPAGWPPYTEVWGIRAAIDATFTSLAAADPALYPVQAAARVSASQILEALEE